MAPVNPVEGTTDTYGSEFGAFSGRLARTAWGQKLDQNLPSFGPAWYYNYVAPRSEQQKYFNAVTSYNPTIHWALGTFWALTTQKLDTIYVLTTNYLPTDEDHPKHFAKAYQKICEDIYDLQGMKRPTINVVVLSHAGRNPVGATRTLERFSPIIRASKGDGSVIEDIRDYMTRAEKKRLESYAGQNN